MTMSKAPKLVVEDRDETSRTVTIKDRKLDIEPDVEVNIRTAIMGDEGPVAETNPHNQSDEPVAPVVPKPRRSAA